MTRKRVLIVDDTATIVLFEKLMLAPIGCEVDTARSGAEALRKALACAPDLVLLDIQMPELDGIETCRRLRQAPQLHEVPIIMVTTRGDPDMVAAAFAAGCSDYLTKPVDKLELLAKVRSYLG